MVVVNLISRVERERALDRERMELSQTIHDTAAQSAYMIGLGIDTAKALAGDGDPHRGAVGVGDLHLAGLRIDPSRSGAELRRQPARSPSRRSRIPGWPGQ